jgi:hypothetical protein
LYNFHPSMVARAVPECWDVASPQLLCGVRATSAAAALAEYCSVDARTDLIAALPLLRRATDGCDSAGRIMAGANRTLWPTLHAESGAEGVAEAWQACTTLREHRGDGHVAALLTHGVSGLEAHLLAAGTKAVPPDLLRDNRGWSEDDWEAATASMARRGLLHPDGRATDAGRTLHASVEALTDRLAEPAYSNFSDAALSDLYGVLLACARGVQSSGLLPFPNPMGLPALP